MERTCKRSGYWICDQVLEHIFQYIIDPLDRAAISEVNKQWYNIEGFTRRHVLVRFAFGVHPQLLVRRFTRIESLAIKGKPRFCDWGILGNHWGAGCGDFWIQHVVPAYSALKSVYLRRLELSDDSLVSLACAFSKTLEVLKLRKCSGFSTAALLAVAQNCRQLKVFSVEESVISDAGEEWLHVLGENNNSLEELDFSLTGLEVGSLEDLAAVVKDCKGLRLLKLGELRTSNAAISNSKAILSSSQNIQELLLLYHAVDEAVVHEHLDYPTSMTSFSGEIVLPFNEDIGRRMEKLDLMLSTLKDSHSHLEVIKSCTNLEELKVRNVIGDEGLCAIAGCCKKLKTIRIENLEDEHGYVSHKGLISLASSCVNLISVAIYASDLSNSALASFGKYCPHLYNFRVAVLDSPGPMSEQPLDDGLRGLLQGCKKLTKLALYLKPGGLSDRGLDLLGQLGNKLKWLLLGGAGYSDAGFMKMSAGCRNLTKLEMRYCPFTEAGIVAGMWSMRNLTLVWCQGYLQRDVRYLQLLGPVWTVEYMPSVEENMTQFLAYKSLSADPTGAGDLFGSSLASLSRSTLSRSGTREP